MEHEPTVDELKRDVKCLSQVCANHIDVEEYCEMKICLGVARAAIVTAIATEDGLDGDAGNAIVKRICNILGDYEEWFEDVKELENLTIKHS